MKPYRKYLAMIMMIGVSFTFLFHFLHFEGALELMLLNGFIFLIFAATDSVRVTMILGALTALILIGGLVFKLMYWPGANMMILISLGLLFPIYMIVYSVRMKQG